MSRKRPRVPGTFTRKVQNLAAVATEHIDEPGIYYQPVRHDDDCPAIRTQSLTDCTCNPEIPAPTRVADADEWIDLARKNDPAYLETIADDHPQPGKEEL